jgi:hypothetical protein
MHSLIECWRRWSAEMTIGARRGGLIAFSSLIMVVTALFILTYPINIAQSDAVGYLEMMLGHRSNLIMASGYPFLFHYLLSLCTALPPLGERSLIYQALLIETPDSLIPEFLLKLLIANHAVHLAIVASVTWILSRTFGLSVALITAFLWSLNLFFLSAVSISQPEFLQADLLMLAVALCSWAFMRDEVRAKLPLYFLASFVFAWVFLVKYNALAFGGFFLLLLYFDSTTIKIKIAGLVACITVFASVLFGYLWLFHYPSTGSWSFHHDRAWVYVYKLYWTFGPNVLDHSPGIAALRWKALTVAIPQEIGGYAYSSLSDSASQEQKQKYRPKVDAILSMTEDELRTYIRDNPPQPTPPGFDFSRTAHPLYWYIGLAEADDLGSAMFWEFMRNNVGVVFKTVVTASVQTTLTSVANPYVPIPARPLDLFPTTNLANGFSQFSTRIQPPIFGTYWSYNLILWKPGMRLFGIVDYLRITPWVERLLYLCLGAGLYWLPRQQNRVICALWLGIIGFILASHFVLVFRPKEAVALWPVGCLLWAIAIKWGFTWTQALTHWLRGPLAVIRRRSSTLGPLRTSCRSRTV